MVQETDANRVANQKPVKRNDMSDMVHRIKAEESKGRTEQVKPVRTQIRDWPEGE